MSSSIRKISIKYDGTISAEHGIGVHKREMLKTALEARGSTAALRIFREIKRIFDPHGIFNPGKIFEQHLKNLVFLRI